MNLNNSSFANNPADSETLTTTAPRHLLTATEAALILGITDNKLASLRHGSGCPNWVHSAAPFATSQMTSACGSNNPKRFPARGARRFANDSSPRSGGVEAHAKVPATQGNWRNGFRTFGGASRYVPSARF